MSGESIITFLVEIVIGASFFVVGVSYGKESLKEEAAKAGAGYWKINPKTGVRAFVWGKP